MRSVSSVFFEARHQDTVKITELLDVDSNAGNWNWTTNNTQMTSSLQVYDPFPGGTGGGIEESTDLGIATVDFVLANSGGVFDALLDSSQLDRATIRIRRVLSDSADIGHMVIYTGKLGDYSYTRREIRGQARSEFDGASVKWPYYTYLDACVWRFGSVGCGFVTSTIVASVQIDQSGADKLDVLVGSAGLTTSGYINGHFDRGRITFLDSVNSGQVRTIRAQSADQIDLSHSLPFAVSSGDSAVIFRGCRKRLIEDCVSVFNNSSNALAFPWIPRPENAF